MKLSIMLLLFYFLAPLQNDCLVTSQCIQFTFGDKREVYLQDESAPLPVTKKEYARGKNEHRPVYILKRDKKIISQFLSD